MSNPFQLLGIEPSFAIDLKAAEEHHLNLSRALHPDRHATAPRAERRETLNRAIAVNEAWRRIKNPISRAEALLELAGIPAGEERRHGEDPEFLMEVMERREALAEAIANRDLDRMSKLSQTVAADKQAVEARLGELFERLLSDRSEADEAALVSGLGRLRFFQRFLDEAAAAEDELF